jgi:hypothetical protein
LASKIFGSAETEDGVSREWLTSELRAFFENWYLDKAKALAAARSLVEFITGRAWVMYDIGPNVFKFTHRTFLEYFFARHLLSSSDSISTLICRHLFPKVSNFEWDLIAHLALQTAVFRDAGKMTQAANTILSLLHQPFPDARSEIGFLSFVAKSLEYLLVPEMRYYEIVRAVLYAVVALGATTDPSSVSVIPTLISSTRRREDIARSAVYEEIKIKLRKLNSSERAFSMYAICASYNTPWMGIPFDVLPPTWQTAGASSSYFETARNDMKEFNHQQALSASTEARLYLFTYKQGYRELFNRFGLDAFYSGGPYRILSEIPDLIQIAISEAAMIELARERRQTVLGRATSDAHEFLEVLFDDLLKKKEISISPEYSLADSAEIANAVVRTIYELAVEVRKPKIEFLVRALVLLALSLDIGEIIRPPSPKGRRVRYLSHSRKKGEVAPRLLQFMPDGAMEQMLKVVEPHELSNLIFDWNARELRFAVRGHAIK